MSGGRELPATRIGKNVRFDTLSRETGNRIARKYVDGVTGKTVENENEFKGHDRGENEHVILEDGR